MSNNQFVGEPAYIRNAPPTDMERNIPTTGMFDDRWLRFEEVYGQFIRESIKAADPAFERAAHDIINRVEKFMNEVMPKYEYRPEYERFRKFLDRLIKATVFYLKGKRSGMEDWKSEFKKVNNGIDADELEEMFDDLALGEVMSSEGLTDEEIIAFKEALAKKHIAELVGCDDVPREYKRVVDEYLRMRKTISLESFLDGLDPKDAA